MSSEVMGPEINPHHFTCFLYHLQDLPMIGFCVFEYFSEDGRRARIIKSRIDRVFDEIEEG